MRKETGNKFSIAASNRDVASCLQQLSDAWLAFKETAVKKHVETHGDYTFRGRPGHIEITVDPTSISFKRLYDPATFTMKDIHTCEVANGRLRIITREYETRDPIFKAMNYNGRWELDCADIEDVDLLLKLIKRSRSGKKLFP